jgi:transcriptional regulator with XRE-family HTH domain
MANPMILERLRKSKSDWGQKEFALKLNVSISTYRRIIKGEAPLTIQAIQQAAKLLKVDQQEIMEGSMEVEEPAVMYGTKKKISVSVELDGTSDTLNYYVSLLKRVNEAI